MNQRLIPERSSGYADIGEYAMIGDRHGSALVCRDGTIDWCCMPSFDADPLFAGILDHEKGGAFAICVGDATRATRRYITGTNALETRLSGVHCEVLLTDFMVVSHRWPDVRALVRIVRVVSGITSISANVAPGALAWSEPQVWRRDGKRLRAGRYVLSDGVLLTPMTDQAAGEWTQLEGETRAFILAFDALPTALSTSNTDMALAMLEDTIAYWRGWSKRISYEGPYRSIIERSTLALKMMLYEPTGAIVAAPTSSLPETLGGVRNWDYRFCWTRDASFTFYALAKLGLFEDAERFFQFFDHICESCSPPLPPLFSIDGARNTTEREIGSFAGFRGSAPVRLGNEAAEQHQLDIYGQLIDLIYLHERLREGIAEKQKYLVTIFADFIAQHWREPDAGLWEPRLQPRHHVHSAIMCWTGLDRAVRLLGERTHWVQAREDILSALRANAAAAGGPLTQTFDCHDADAAVLIAAVVGMPLEREIIEATCDFVISELGAGPLVYRYRNDDGLPGKEGTFLVCAFWLVDALLILGRVDEARQRFDQLLGYGNDVGLYSEQMGEDGCLLGNFPQAFTHLGVIQSALLLDLVERNGVEALQGTYADRAMGIIETLLRIEPKELRGGGDDA